MSQFEEELRAELLSETQNPSLSNITRVFFGARGAAEAGFSILVSIFLAGWFVGWFGHSQGKLLLVLLCVHFLRYGLQKDVFNVFLSSFFCFTLFWI